MRYQRDVEDKSDLERLDTLLMQSPTDCSQVISARLALRILPMVLKEDVADNWIDRFSIGLLRAAATTWILSHEISEAGDRHLSPNGARAAADAAFVARAVADAADVDGLTASVEADVQWLKANSAHASGAELSSERLARAPLWLSRDVPAATSSSVPEWHSEAWESARRRLLGMGNNHEVWVDWYERVLAGSSPAFGRTLAVENFVKGMLLDADQTFWLEEPAVVNETIVRWIAQLDLEDELADLIERVRTSTRPGAGTAVELRARSRLAVQLSRLSALEAPIHAPLGHNHPPEPDEWRLEAVLLASLREQAAEAMRALEPKIPDSALVVEKTGIIAAALKKLRALTGRAAGKAADAFGTTFGGGAAVGLWALVTIVYGDLLAAIVTWPNAMIG
jgi:hypothetical protein